MVAAVQICGQEGTLHLSHIYLDVMRSVIKSCHHLFIYMIECYVTSLRYHHSRDDHLSHAVYVGVDIVA